MLFNLMGSNEIDIHKIYTYEKFMTLKAKENSS